MLIKGKVVVTAVNKRTEKGIAPMLDILSTLFQMLQGQLINIPTDNALGVFYVILNIILTLFTPLFGG